MPLKGLGWLEALTDIGALQCQLYHPLYYLKFFTQYILFIFPLPQLLPGPPLFPISLPPNFQLHACFFFSLSQKAKNTKIKTKHTKKPWVHFVLANYSWA